jgi:hypothetical protein
LVEAVPLLVVEAVLAQVVVEIDLIGTVTTKVAARAAYV